jgi:hypothetical protein
MINDRVLFHGALAHIRRAEPPVAQPGAANSRLLLTIRYFESPSDPACCQGFPGTTTAAPRLESTEWESGNLPKKLQGALDNMWPDSDRSDFGSLIWALDLGVWILGGAALPALRLGSRLSAA